MTAPQGNRWKKQQGEVATPLPFVEGREEAKRVYGGHDSFALGRSPTVVIKRLSSLCRPHSWNRAAYTRKAGRLGGGLTWGESPHDSNSRFRPWRLRYGGTRCIPPGFFSVLTGARTEIGGEMTSQSGCRKVTSLVRPRWVACSLTERQAISRSFRWR